MSISRWFKRSSGKASSNERFGDDDPRLTELTSSFMKHITIAEKISIQGAGSDGPLIKIAWEFEKLHKADPGNPKLHYCYAEAMAAALQQKTETQTLNDLLRRHPHFWIAAVTLRHGPASGIFILPEFDVKTIFVHPRINREVKQAVIIATRSGVLPRAVLFFRDANNELAQVALNNCRMDLTTVVDARTEPKIAAVYGRIFDHPQHPLQFECFNFPFDVSARFALELFSRQNVFEFVILDPVGQIKHHRTITPSARMCAAHAELARLFDIFPESKKLDLGTCEIAMKRYKSTINLKDVAY
jgi:hypothetical protein